MHVMAMIGVSDDMIPTIVTAICRIGEQVEAISLFRNTYHLDSVKFPLARAQLLIVTNPDGTLHRYARVGEMIPVEPTRNPEYAPPVDPTQTALADAAYLAQTLLELGDPPLSYPLLRSGLAEMVTDGAD